MEPRDLPSSSLVLTRKTTLRSTSVSGVVTRIIRCLVRRSGRVTRALALLLRWLTSVVTMLPPTRRKKPLAQAACTVVSTLVTSATEAMGYIESGPLVDSFGGSETILPVLS
jgi:hypothetical protein